MGKKIPSGNSGGNGGMITGPCGVIAGGMMLLLAALGLLISWLA